MTKRILVVYYRKGVYGVRPDPDNPNFEYLLPTDTMMFDTIALIFKGKIDKKEEEHEDATDTH